MLLCLMDSEEVAKWEEERVGRNEVREVSGGQRSVSKSALCAVDNGHYTDVMRVNIYPAELYN